MSERHLTAELNRRHRLDNALAAASAISNSTTETTILQSRTHLRRADFKLGLNFEIYMTGSLTTIDSGTGNDLDIDVLFGSTSIAQLEANSLGTNASIVPWIFQWAGRIHTLGSSGKIVGAGQLWVGQATSHIVSSYTVAAGTTVDLSYDIREYLKVTGQWGTANASNVLNIYTATMRFMVGQA